LKLGYSNTKKLRGIGGRRRREVRERGREGKKQKKTKEKDTEFRRKWNVSNRRRCFLTPVWKEGGDVGV